VTGPAVEEADGGTKVDLASRLKDKGISLPSASAAPVPLSGGIPVAPQNSDTAGVGTVHAPLSVTSSEKKQLFTPLANQGSKAIEAEQKRKAESEQDLLNGVRNMLKRWVQECLVKDDKRDKFLEKGSLKCRVQAKYSEGFHDKLKKMVNGYGGQLIADWETKAAGGKNGSQDGGKKPPGWLPRDEKWLVSFDVAAFESFMRSHPEVVDPPAAKVRGFVDSFLQNIDVEAIRIKDLFQALETKFGHVRKAVLDRAKQMAADVINRRAEEEMKPGVKRKIDGAKGAPGPKKKKTTPKDESKEARIETAEDVTWATATLAPMGLRDKDGDPIMRSPASISLPILEGLKALENMEDFRNLLKSTQIGKVVNNFRHHPSPEVSSAAKALVVGWKTRAAQKDKTPREAKKKTLGRTPTDSSVGAPALKSATEVADVAMESQDSTQQNGEPKDSSAPNSTAVSSTEPPPDSSVSGADTVMNPAEEAQESAVQEDVANTEKVSTQEMKEDAEPEVASAAAENPPEEIAPVEGAPAGIAQAEIAPADMAPAEIAPAEDSK